jgi:hypothetical protein
MAERPAVLLWEVGKAVCLCRTIAVDRIEITVVVDNEIAVDSWFDNHEEAARFAIDLMHTYQAR